MSRLFFPPARAAWWTAWWPLLLALCVGALLRALYIADEGFWFDEFIIREQAQMGYGEMLEDMVLNDVHPPLYQFLMVSWTRLVGATSELWLRLPSLIVGVAGIGAIWALANRLFDRNIAHVAALLLAVNEYAVYFAQEARAYSLLLTLSVATVWAWFGLLREVTGPRAVVYGVVGVLLAYTHAFGVLLLVYLALVYLYLAGRKQSGAWRFWHWVGVHLGMAAAFAPWLPALLEQNSRVQDGFWIPEPSWFFWSEYFAKYSGHRVLGFLALPLLVFVVWHLWSRRAESSAPDASGGDSNPLSEPATIGFLVGWFVFLLAVPFTISKIGQPVMHAKSAISVVAPLMIVLAFGAVRLAGVRARVWGSAWLAASLFAIVATNYWAQNREAWREMAVAIGEEADSSDLIVMYHPDYDYFYCYDYYLDRHVSSDVRRYRMLCDGEACAAAVGQVESLAETAGARRIWVMKIRASDASPPGLDRRWQPARTDEFNNGRLVVMEPRPGK